MNLQILFLTLNILLFALYLPLNRRKSKYYWQTKVDAWIPYIRFSVIPYTFFAPYVTAVIILLWNTELSIHLLLNLFVATIMGSLFWFFFPNGSKRTIRAETDFSSRLVNWYYKHDSDSNAFPSSHVYTSLIASYYAALTFPQFSILFALIGSVIAGSTVFTKQHYILDILGGVIVLFLSILIVPLIVVLLLP